MLAPHSKVTLPSSWSSPPTESRAAPPSGVPLNSGMVSGLLFRDNSNSQSQGHHQFNTSLLAK